MKYTFLSLLIASSLVWTAATPAETSLRPDMDLQLANVNVGDQAPELAYQNPNVVRIYNEYKDKRYTAGKGFEIYSVSLDQAKDRWIQAIEKDGLVWASHVSDLRGWKAQGAALYGVNSIPMTFLVDSNGKVIAKGLRGAQLEAALKSLLK